MKTKRLHKIVNWHGRYGKWARLSGAGLILFSLSVPALSFINDVKSYALSPAAEQIIGQANPNLSAKFTYDPQNADWQFNKNGSAAQAAQASQLQSKLPDSKAGAALSQLQSQVGGDGKNDNSLYSVNLPVQARRGVTYFDNNTGLSFTMTPEFHMRDGKLWQGRIVYPMDDGMQLVYTAKNNGLKEDLILSKNIGAWLSYSYKLKLPNTLEARLLDDGSVGIYSADPALFGNISYGSDDDFAKVMNARRTAPKDHLVFAIPAPIIKDHNGQHAQATYSLADNELTVTANRLDQLSYPLSVDPSVVITTTSDFSSGNNEGNIDYSTADQATLSGVTGATLGSFGSNTSFTTARYLFGAAVYNGYIYVAGGLSSGGDKNDVQYAQITSGGTLSAWASTNSFANVRDSLAAVAYNGYLYIFGGHDSSSNTYNDVQYAPINANGTLGTWATTTSFSTARYGLAATAYNGYLYVVGGLTAASAYQNDVQYAPIHADGTVGTWQSTSSFTTGRYGLSAPSSNGYLYVLGGKDSGGTIHNDVQYAYINSDGTLGTWHSTTSFTNARFNVAASIYEGYIYVAGGYDGSTYRSDVEFGQVNANGTVGKWRTTSSFTNGRYGLSALAYQGWLYVTGGYNGTYYADTQSAQMSTAGTMSDYSTTTSLPLALSQGASTIHNGCLYYLGGSWINGGTTVYSSNVYYATINSDGTIGSWTLSTHTMVTGVRVFGFATDGYHMYVIGGFNGTNQSAIQYVSFASSGCDTGTWQNNPTSYPSTHLQHAATYYNGYVYSIGTTGSTSTAIYSAPVNSDGTLGSWTLQTTTMVTAHNKDVMIAYGGYIYVQGVASGASTNVNVDYAPITGPGTVGTWQSATSLNTGRDNAGMEVFAGYLYIYGGEDGTNDLSTTEYAKINSDGSLGTWQYNTTLGDSTSAFGTAISGDTIYFVDGLISGVRTTSVRKMIINNGGGGLAGSWSNQSTFTTGRAYAGTVAANGYIYLAGGTTSGGSASDVQYAKLNADGTLGSWATTTSLPAARTHLTMASYNGYVYALGGSVSGSTTSDVLYAQVGSNGALGSWQTGTSFTTNRQDAQAAAYNGKLYIMGGGSGSSYFNDVQYATLSSNGSVGSWASTNSFTTGRSQLMVSINDGYMYVIGGYNGAALSDVQYATIQSGGTLSSWTTTTSLPSGVYLGASAVDNGYLYVAGGLAINNTVQLAPLNANGTIGNWYQTTSFTTSRSGHGMVAYSGYLYLIGGYDGTNYLTNTQSSALSTVARVAHYSKMINLGYYTYVFSGAYYNGTQGASLQYRVAGSDGVFGSSGSGSTGSGSGPSTSCTIGTTQYIWVFLTLDGSGSTAFPYANTEYATDISVYYASSLRPPPNLRLYGGKWFNNQVLQPLDTCGP